MDPDILKIDEYIITLFAVKEQTYLGVKTLILQAYNRLPV